MFQRICSHERDRDSIGEEEQRALSLSRQLEHRAASYCLRARPRRQLAQLQHLRGGCQPEVHRMPRRHLDAEDGGYGWHLTAFDAVQAPD